MAPQTFRLALTTTAILTTLVTSGCSLAPEYHRPELATPLNWNQQEVLLPSEDRETSSAQPYFSDKHLKQLIQLTTEGNKDLELSALNLKKSGEQYGVERLSLLPNLGMNAQKTAAHLPSGIFDTVDTGAVTYQQYDVKFISASWEIDFWGRLRSLKESSLNEYLAAGASTRALKINLIEQTVGTYFSYLSSREQVKIAEQQLKNRLAQKAMAKASFDAGALSMSDVITAAKIAEDASLELTQLKLQSQKDYNALEFLVGKPLPESLFIDVKLEKEWSFPPLRSGLSSKVLLKRPDIMSAEYELKAANARIGAARAAFFPSISITADGGTSSAELGNLFSSGTQSWSFVPAINLPIFDGGKNNANLNIAELNQKIEVANYQKTIQQAFRDVSDALAGQVTMQAQYEQSQSVWKMADKQYEMANESMEAGEISNKALLEKNNELLEARKNVINSKLNYLVQSVKIYSVLGGDNSI